MISKFPRLPKKKKQELVEWLESQKHKYKSEYHSYKACGNDEAAEQSSNYASCMAYIQMMMEYHEADK